MAVAPAPPHFPLPPGHALTATSTASRSQASDVALMVATALRDDGRHTLSFSRRDFGLSFAYSLAHLRREGAGKAGRRLRPQATVCNGRNNAHGFDRYSRDIPTFPAQWLYGLLRALPGERPLLSPLPRHHGAAWIDARVAAPGPHDFAVRCSVSSGASTYAASVHRNPRQRSVTTAKRPLWWARAGRSTATDLPDEARIISDFSITDSL